MTSSTRKNGLPDRRFHCSRVEIIANKKLARRLFIQQLVAVAGLGFLLGSILTKTIWDINQPQKALLSPLGQSILPQVQIVEAKEERNCNDAISYIRCSGEDLGKSNATIMQMIRIAKHESNFNPRAKNRTSSASGVFQIIAGTWYSNDCVGDKWNFKDNTDCAWKIQTRRGFTPWEVYNKGIAK